MSRGAPSRQNFPEGQGLPILPVLLPESSLLSLSPFFPICTILRSEGRGFSGGSERKESACNAGDLGSIPGSGRSPGEGHGNPLQCSCLENPHGERSLAGSSPWGCKSQRRLSD